MGAGKTIWNSRLIAAVLALLPLPEGARALTSVAETKISLPELQGLSPLSLYNTPLVLALDREWPIASLWGATPAWPSADSVAAPIEDSRSVVFDIGKYDPMWNDSLFSEMAAYGGLRSDAQRVAGMQSLGGSDAANGVPYGRLTLEREFLEGQHRLTLGAYGSQTSVRPTAISGFGDDSYTDVAADGTWRWIAHPERGASEMIAAHILILHEGESLMASHAIFGTGRTDALTIFRGDVSFAWGGPIAPTVQYFQVSGTSDPVRLGTLDGSPDSKGMVAEMDYAPPTAHVNVRLALQFIAYSEFDGSVIDASHNDTILLHLTMGGEE